MKTEPDEILENWNALTDTIDNTFSGDIKDNIVRLITHFEDRIIEAPASTKPQYHNCWVGGWLDHTLRVINTSLAVKKHFESLGVIVTSSEEDTILAAFAHDLGKLGDLDSPYYITQTDQWRRNKLSEWYTWNNSLEPMSVTDRSLWLLQHFDIKISEEVWKAIKMSDGLFDDGNKTLFRVPDTNRNILHYIIHFADWISTTAEKQHYHQSLLTDDYQETDKPFNSTSVKRVSGGHANAKDLKKKFDELFGGEK